MIKIRKIKKIDATESRCLKSIGGVDAEKLKVKTSNMFNNFSKVHIYPQIVTENIEEGDLMMYRDTWTLYIVEKVFDDLKFKLRYVSGKFTLTPDFVKVANNGDYELYD